VLQRSFWRRVQNIIAHNQLILAEKVFESMSSYLALQLVLDRASALNLLRLADWLDEAPRAKTRRSTFARLMRQAAWASLP